MGPSGLISCPVSEAKPPVVIHWRVSLELFHNPAAWKCCMRASMRADGMTCCSRHIRVKTIGLGSTERNEGGPHTDIVAVETKGITSTMAWG